jgi:hypothetical protein
MIAVRAGWRPERAAGSIPAPDLDAREGALGPAIPVQIGAMKQINGAVRPGLIADHPPGQRAAGVDAGRPVCLTSTRVAKTEG